MPIIEPGDPCNRCFGPGGPLGTGVTPKYIFAHFVDWLDGPKMNPFYRAELTPQQTLHQDVQACRWSLLLPNTYWTLNWHVWPFSLSITSTWDPTAAAFWNGNIIPCLLTYDNTLLGGINDITIGGHINLHFYPD